VNGSLQFLGFSNINKDISSLFFSFLATERQYQERINRGKLEGLLRLNAAAAELLGLLRLLIYYDNNNINLNPKITITFIIYKEKANKKLVYKLREEGIITISKELFEKL